MDVDVKVLETLVYTEPGEAGQKCESGCANVLVTVTDPQTGKAAQGAKVTASDLRAPSPPSA